MERRHAAVAILLARSHGVTYYLTVQRANSKKWLGNVMLGPAETAEPKDGGRMQDVMLRGLREEIGLERERIKRVGYYQTVGPSVRESHNYDAHFFTVEVDLPTLRRVSSEIRAGKWHELSGARVSRGFAQVVRRMKGNGKSPASVLQPHTQLVFERLTRRRGVPSRARRSR